MPWRIVGSILGLDADKAPATWEEFLNACEKLKSAGIAPVGGGIQDGYWGEWYFGHGIGQWIRASSEEALQIDHGSLYPALHRLEKQEWIAFLGWTPHPVMGEMKIAFD